MSKKLFSIPTVLLTAACLILNIALVWLTGVFGIPLYLDSIGTVIAAALGGALPGIAVGFLSNCMTALLAVTPDPMTLYYGFLNVLIAVLAAWFSERGLLLKWYGKLAAVFAFSMVGGALGSMTTWALYGFSFGQGISAPLAGFLYGSLPWGEFPAQFVADMAIDLADKFVTILILDGTLRFLPAAVMERMPLGWIYKDRRAPLKPKELRERAKNRFFEGLNYRKRSIHTKITLLIIVSSTILSIVAVTIGINTYRNKQISQFSVMCGNAVSLMRAKIDGDRVETFLLEGESAEGYAETERELNDIFQNVSLLKYMYVYAIRPDGCHVVFDLDADGLNGEPAGTVVPFDGSFPYLKEVLAGEEIPAFITNDTYGWLLTIYQPVRDSAGNVVAYAAADIDMQGIKTNIYSYCISIVSLLFGVLILITTFSLWYCDKKLLEPLTVLTEQARDLDYDGTRKGNRVRDRLAVQTGDELEELFRILCRTEDTLAERVSELQRKNQEISCMQRNIIYALANMVENRDENTGGHIKRTAAYVRLIGLRLKSGGLYQNVVDDQYIKLLYDSAPLHDIGKIKIPDAILNKPGKLTPDEFDEMKTHTTRGRDILKLSLTGIEDDTWLGMAIDMASCHHEKWDGSGYPYGLKGDKIPLCARIMAVSDVFDALVSARSYKPPFSYEEAASIIRHDAGTHFDPEIAAVFLGAEDEIKTIMAMEQ